MLQKSDKCDFKPMYKEPSYAEWYKGTKLMAFDAEFRSNVSLPDFVGLRKGVSLGMGTVVRRYDEERVETRLIASLHDATCCSFRVNAMIRLCRFLFAKN